MAKTIAIVDYGAGNLRSIWKALARVATESSADGTGPAVVVTMDPAVVAAADAVVLPGVGAAGATMRHLERHGNHVAQWKQVDGRLQFHSLRYCRNCRQCDQSVVAVAIERHMVAGK